MAELEIRNAYRNYVSARKQMDFRKKSVDLGRRDYDLQARDDRQGLVTSLEVIESLNTKIETVGKMPDVRKQLLQRSPLDDDIHHSI